MKKTSILLIRFFRFICTLIIVTTTLGITSGSSRVYANANSPENNKTTPIQQGLLTDYGIALESISTFAGFFSTNDKGDVVFYGTTRSGEYCRLYRLNLDKNYVDLTVHIREAKGAWTVVQDGDSIYVGTYEPAALYQYTISTGVLTRIAELDGETYIWDMKLEERTLYMGTFPSAKVYLYHLDKRELKTLGSFSKEKYVRSIEIAHNKIYAGIGARADLIEYDLERGTVRRILPPQYSDNSFVYHLKQVGNMLFIGLSPSGRILGFNLETRQMTTMMEDTFSDPGTTTPTFGPEMIHFRGFGDFLYEYNTATEKLTRLLPEHDLPLVGGEIVGERTIKGVTRDAVYVELAFDGTAKHSIYLNKLGLDRIMTIPTELTAYGGRVFLAERQLRDFNKSTHTEGYHWLMGEPKAMCVINNDLYSAHYPGAYLWKFPREEFADSTSLNLTDPAFLMLDIEESQYRPTSARCGTDYVLIGSEPGYGLYGGALTYYSSPDDWYTVRNIVRKHNIQSIAIEESPDSRYAYLGTNAAGGSGTIPLDEEAHLVKYDLIKRVIVFDTIPLKKKNPTILHLEVENGIIYSLMSKGRLYTIDATTGKIIAFNNMDEFTDILLSKYGDLYAIRGNDFGIINKQTLQFSIITTLPSLILLTEDSLTGEIFMISEFNLWGYRKTSRGLISDYPYQ